MGIENIHPKKDVPWIVSEFETQVRGEKSLAKNVPCLRKDGTVVYADINSFNLHLENRIVNVGIFRDMTERRKNEEMMEHYANHAHIW